VPRRLQRSLPPSEKKRGPAVRRWAKRIALLPLRGPRLKKGMMYVNGIEVKREWARAAEKKKKPH